MAHLPTCHDTNRTRRTRTRDRARRRAQALVGALVVGVVTVGVAGDVAAGEDAFQADGRIRKGNKPFKGDGIINLDGADQTVKKTLSPGENAKFYVRVRNRGNAPDGFNVFDNVPDPDPSIRVRYYYKGDNVTNQVDNVFGFRGEVVEPAKSTPPLKMKVKVKQDPVAGSLNFGVNAQSKAGDAATRDTVHVIVFVGD